MAKSDAIYRSPPFEAWGESLYSWLGAAAPREDPLRRSIRQEVLGAAHLFEEKKNSLTKLLTGTERAYTVPDSTDAIFIVAGHQPVIYHNGLLRKQLDTTASPLSLTLWRSEP